jgi:hypothetical protein
MFRRACGDLLACFFTFARKAAGAFVHRHSLCPLCLSRDETMHHSGAKCAAGTLSHMFRCHALRRHRLSCLTCKSEASSSEPHNWFGVRRTMKVSTSPTIRGTEGA